jgi:hypothetical protein
MKAELTVRIMYQWIPKYVTRKPLIQQADYNTNDHGGKSAASENIQI